MADRISKERRSWNMSRIRGTDTEPERQLRSLLHRSGYRFRLHDPTLPGRPDIVLKKYRSVIFVHGCFWHRHKDCPKASTVKSQTDFWKRKFEGTIARDSRRAVELAAKGWQVIIVWECELERDDDTVLNEIRRKLRRCV